MREGSRCSPVADVWSLGLTLIEVATGEFPFPPDAMVSIMDLVECIIGYKPVLPAHFSKEFKAFLTASLQSDPSERMTPEQCLVMVFLY